MVVHSCKQIWMKKTRSYVLFVVFREIIFLFAIKSIFCACLYLLLYALPQPAANHPDHHVYFTTVLICQFWNRREITAVICAVSPFTQTHTVWLCLSSTGLLLWTGLLKYLF